MKLLSLLDTPFEVKLSFYQIIEDLETLAAHTADPAHSYAKALLEDITPYPELKDGITDSAQIKQHQELISRLVAGYFPKALSSNEIKAISIPYTNIIFNHTERFTNLLQAAGTNFEINIRDFDEHQFYVLSCCIILNRFYGTRLDFSKPLFYDIPTANGVTRHYRILYNADFLAIVPNNNCVKLTQEDIDRLMNNYEDLDLWKQKFPKESWTLKGFAVMTLVDVTVENAVSLLKEKLLGITAGFQKGIESIFRSIYQIPDIQIGFTLHSQHDEKFTIATFGQPIKSFLLPHNNQMDDKDVLCLESYQYLVKEKTYFAISDTAEVYASDTESRLANHFFSQGFRSFILAPVVKNNVLLGVLEVASPRAKELNSINANKLDVVMPFLTETIERLIDELQNQVLAVIQDKYTAIHTSVYWKFLAEAKTYIYNRQLGIDYTLKEIAFKGVHPLYGQIDIKGSSEARNLSTQKDLQTQLQDLLNILNKVTEKKHLHTFETAQLQLNSFLTDLALSLKADTEQYIASYLTIHIHDELKQVIDPELTPLINRYFIDNDKKTGYYHTYRRKYDQTVSMINELMTGIIDKQQVAAQGIFPHYYERFKTDGVEHNLYIGPSISPALDFNIDYLHQLRLWQMQVLCEMEIAHNHLKPSLPYALDVATLILVYSATLAIRFRMDEKRFDVDGSYNARFEIVKKRIDKAYIKNTLERITQPGKLTIVYSNEFEEAEYKQYIAVLQTRNLLNDSVEYLMIEDLQGVSGLKALRIGIVHPANR